MKERRQRAILTLVATRPIHSQEELVALLAEQGFDAVQATVSRDIKELGLVKVPVKSERGDEALFKYVLPNATVQYASRLHRVVAELVLSVEGSANLIVLKTPPGSGMMVASAIDDAGWSEIMGTIGGDDTILVIVRDAKKMPMVVQRFRDLGVGGDA